MLDDKTPHVACVVQAVTPAPDGKSLPTVAATTLTDENGKYGLKDLQPGRYQIRCYTTKGYIYHQEGKILPIEIGKTLTNINFRFPPFKKGFWRNYTIADGLPNGRVWAIHQDSEGFIWFGTWGGGVLRFDGNQFVNFTTKDGLAGNSIRPIYSDNVDGYIWIGTSNGLSRYDG